MSEIFWLLKLHFSTMLCVKKKNEGVFLKMFLANFMLFRLDFFGTLIPNNNAFKQPEGLKYVTFHWVARRKTFKLKDYFFNVFHLAAYS